MCFIDNNSTISVDDLATYKYTGSLSTTAHTHVLPATCFLSLYTWPHCIQVHTLLITYLFTLGKLKPSVACGAYTVLANQCVLQKSYKRAKECIDSGTYI